MRVFLTGSLGYVGTVLEELLQKENFEVVGCDVGYFPKSLEDSKNENFLGWGKSEKVLNPKVFQVQNCVGLKSFWS